MGFKKLASKKGHARKGLKTCELVNPSIQEAPVMVEVSEMSSN